MPKVAFVGAQRSLDEIRRLVNDLIDGHGNFVPPLTASA
jgi:hypothetical protein